MLPIALACPLWWVARWTTRMVASLAVVVACSLGAVTLPLASAATAQAAAPAPAVDTSTVRAGHLPGAGQASRVLFRWSGRAAAAVAGAGAGAGASETTASSGARGGQRASGADVAAAERQVDQVGPARADRAGVPVAGSGPAVAAVRRQHILAGLLPASVGSRAPPVR